MALHIKTATRPQHLVQADIINDLGGAEEVAGVLRLQPITVRKAMQDPSGSGQPITVKNLQGLLLFAGQHLANLTLQNHVDELLQEHFLNLCHRSAYPQEKIFLVMDVLRNGHRSSL